MNSTTLNVRLCITFLMLYSAKDLLQCLRNITSMEGSRQN